jgi:cobalt/nickel transport system permease protein
MQHEIVRYARLDSPAHRMDPRWKLAALGVCGMALVCLQTVPATAMALAGALTLLIATRLPLRWLLARMGGVAAFLALFFILLPLTMPGDEIALGPLRLSERGLEVATLVCLKALAFVALVLLVVATSPIETTLQAAHALRVPGLVVQLLTLAYRYIFLLGDELGRLRVALRVRAYRNRASWHCYRTIGNAAGTLLVRSFERAERVSAAMRCRGFDGRFRSLHAFQTRASDLGKFAIVVAVLAGLPLLVEFGPRFLSREGA